AKPNPEMDVAKGRPRKVSQTIRARRSRLPEVSSHHCGKEPTFMTWLIAQSRMKNGNEPVLRVGLQA
ncbi:MAG: hypothetical protein ACI8P0_005384, partial [Planctomycetaceae bacterium]